MDLRWRSGSRSIASSGRHCWSKRRSSANSVGHFDGKWKDLMEKERKRIEGAVALVLDLAKAFERVSLQVVWAWATHFSLARKILRVLCDYSEHQRRVQFEGCAAERSRTITAILQGSKRSSLLMRIVLQDALSEVTKIYILR